MPVARSTVKVFISYTHESTEHSQRVLQLSDKLREWGIDSWIDQYEQAPTEGWLNWMQKQIRKARFVLVICTMEYRRRFEASPRGRGKGVRFEGAILTTQIYESIPRNRRIIPVLCSRQDAKHIPTVLRNYSFYDVSTEEGFEDLYRHLTNQPNIVAAPLGPTKEMTPGRRSTTPLMRHTILGTPVNPSESQTRDLFRRLIAQSVNYSPPFRKDLPGPENEHWSQSLSKGDGPSLCLFGPGSGKNFFLTQRVAFLIESGVPPSQILILTTTDVAAREISFRLKQVLPKTIKSPTCSPLHQVALSVLRNNTTLLDIPSTFGVLDDEAATNLIAELARGSTAKGGSIPEAAIIRNLNSYSVNTLLSIEGAISAAFPWLFWAGRHVLNICSRYDREKRRRGLMDFDDLLLAFYKLLATRPDVLATYRHLWRHVIVDDYHQLTRLQTIIVNHLAGERGNLMAFANEWESIDFDRGASVQNVFDFCKLHPGAGIITLETNYRSTPQIVAIANSIQQWGSQYQRRTMKAIRESGAMPRLVFTAGPDKQAVWVCDEIERLIGDSWCLRDIAILYRARHTSLELQLELKRRGIAFRTGDDLEFFSQSHVRDVIACIRFAINDTNEVAVKRLIRVLPSFDKLTSEMVWNLIAQGRSDEVSELFPKEARQGWRELQVTIGELRSLRHAPNEMIRHLLESSYGQYLQANFSDYAQCVADIKRMAEYGKQFTDVTPFLHAISAGVGSNGSEKTDRSDIENVIGLLTAKESRGYGFRGVFVIGLVDGEFPDSEAMQKEGGEDAERRLFYLAVTRASERLYFSVPLMPAKRSDSPLHRLSRFIEELDQTTYNVTVIDH